MYNFKIIFYIRKLYFYLFLNLTCLDVWLCHHMYFRKLPSWDTHYLNIKSNNYNPTAFEVIVKPKNQS